MPSDVSIRCLLAAASFGSFTKAADHLFMTRQAVSQQIAALERELDAKLFDRTTAKITPTPVGELYIDYFTDALHRWEEVRRKADAIRVKEGATIRVGSLYATELGSYVLDQVEESRRQGHQFDVVWERREPHELLNGLVSGQYDVVFVFNKALEDFPEPDRLEYFSFLQAQGVLVVHSDSPLVKGPDASARDFEHAPCYLAAGMQQDARAKAEFLREFAAYGMHFTDVRILPNRESVQTMVELGQGTTVCTDLERFSRYPSNLSFPLGRYQEILCVWRRNEPRPQVRHFAEAMRRRKADFSG